MTKYFLDNRKGHVVGWDGSDELYICPFIGETCEDIDVEDDVVELAKEPEVPEKKKKIKVEKIHGMKRQSPTCANCGKRGHFAKTCSGGEEVNDAFTPYGLETIRNIKKMLEDGKNSVDIAIHYKISLLEANEAIDIARKTK